MPGTSRILLGLGIVAVTAGTLFAQRGSFGVARAPSPSSTAIGAGALSFGPSSTARSTAPSFGFTRPGNGYSGYSYNRNYARSNAYRSLPRSYVIAPFYYPNFDWSGGTDYSNAPYDDSGYGGYGYGPDPATDAMMANQAALGQQVQRLTAQMNGIMYGQQYQPDVAAQQQAPPAIPLTLVLRSGERLQVQNYAVTDNTFWDFTQRGTRKIPLSNIDVTASEKATQAAGGDFPQLDGNQ